MLVYFYISISCGGQWEHNMSSSLGTFFSFTESADLAHLEQYSIDYGLYWREQWMMMLN